MNDEPSDDTPQIVITFEAPGSAKVTIGVSNVSPFQMWGAARMLEQYAEDAWNNAQMQQAMNAAKAQQETDKLHALTSDHLPKGN